MPDARSTEVDPLGVINLIGGNLADRYTARSIHNEPILFSFSSEEREASRRRSTALAMRCTQDYTSTRHSELNIVNPSIRFDCPRHLPRETSQCFTCSKNGLNRNAAEFA